MHNDSKIVFIAMLLLFFGIFLVALQRYKAAEICMVSNRFECRILRFVDNSVNRIALLFKKSDVPHIKTEGTVSSNVKNNNKSGK